MGAIGKLIKLALADEDTVGKVLANSSGRGGARTLWQNAAKAKGGTFKNFVNLLGDEVKYFDQNMNLASDVFDSKTLKAIRKNSGAKNFKSYNQELIDFVSKNKGKFESAEDATTAVKNFLTKNGVTKPVENAGFFKRLFGKSSTQSVDDIAKNASKNLIKNAGEEAAEAGVKKGVLSKVGNFFKGKGGTLAIALNLVFEIPEIVKAFKNGDGAKQVGRSAINIAGGAAGAAAGAAIGSIIPVAGTAIGGAIGFLAGMLGGMGGYAISKKVGDGIFGKSLQEQKDEAEMKFAQQQQALAQQQQQQCSFSAMA